MRKEMKRERGVQRSVTDEEDGATLEAGLLSGLEATKKSSSGESDGAVEDLGNEGSALGEGDVDHSERGGSCEGKYVRRW